MCIYLTADSTKRRRHIFGNISVGWEAFNATARKGAMKERKRPPDTDRVLAGSPRSPAAVKNPPARPYKAEPWCSRPQEVTSWLTAGREKAHTPTHLWFQRMETAQQFPLSLERGRARETGKASPSKSDPAHCSSQRNFFSFAGFLYSFIVFKCTKMRCWRMLSKNLSSKG